MVKVIDSFIGDYEFLSNFYDCNVMYEGLMYKNSEAAFQSAKLKMNNDNATRLVREQFTYMSASKSKRVGRSVALRPDWEDVKDTVMYEILKDKFTRNSDLKQKLLNTGESILIEGNVWHDNYWGDCQCADCNRSKGKNRLGILLMKIRKELRESKDT